MKELKESYSKAAIFAPCATALWGAARGFDTCNALLFSQATDLIFLRFSDKNITVTNTTIAIWCD